VKISHSWTISSCLLLLRACAAALLICSGICGCWCVTVHWVLTGYPVCKTCKTIWLLQLICSVHTYISQWFYNSFRLVRSRTDISEWFGDIRMLEFGTLSYFILTCHEQNMPTSLVQIHFKLCVIIMTRANVVCCLSQCGHIICQSSSFCILIYMCLHITLDVKLCLCNIVAQHCCFSCVYSRHLLVPGPCGFRALLL